MKTLIFSDTHLTHHFNQKKFDKLKSIIKKADQVIINGDFFDGYLTSFDKFCESQWKKLFPDLKERNTVYVLGNHDKHDFINNKAKLFSSKILDQYEFKSGEKNFLVRHGHHLAPSLEKKLKFLAGWHYRYRLIKLIYLFYDLGKSFSINLVGTKFYYAHFNKMETKALRKWAKKNLPKNMYLIAGHTHYQILDLKNHFIGAGMINFNRAQYALIENGEVSLHDEKY